MKFAFYTLGCKVNQYETAAMQRQVIAAGHQVVDAADMPDVFVLNSCTVTAESDRKARQIMRRYRKSLPAAVTVLTGCLPQAFPADAAALDAADIVLGNTTNDKLLDSVQRFISSGERVVDIGTHLPDERFDTPTIDNFAEHTRAYIKIEDGCNRFCTYCIIPYARGRVRSKAIDTLRREVAELAANGYKEIVLVGINLSAYADGGHDLANAVTAAASVGGIERVRLGSLEPDMMSDDMLSRLADCEKFCPQFHLSLQSGCDKTLKAMNRHYDSAFYYDLCCRIRAAFNNPSITTDIMVGFAGESDGDFEQSLAFADKVGFAQAHVFAYSQRAGTVAAGRPDQVAKSVKECRSRRMIEVTLKSQRSFWQSQVGRKATVLVERLPRGKCTGYTENYTPVIFDGSSDLCGRTVKVKITGITDDGCTAVITE